MMREASCGREPDAAAEILEVLHTVLILCRILKIFKKTFKKDLLFSMRYNIIVKYQVHGLLVKRLRRRPLTAETGVRFPYKLLTVE